MLRVTKLTDYATLLLSVLAQSPDRVHSASELAETSRLELTTVAKVLKPLTQSELVQSFRGANGGYRLTRPADQISLIDVVQAMEGPLGMTECSVHEGQCGIEDTCGTRGNWQQVNDIVIDALKNFKLSQMHKQIKASKRIPTKLTVVN